ncbi:MAG: NAD(P)-dependent oxidoreductase [Phycisphaerae bacterium]|nr:NAD(P)-dependent oxidoreductase [Phycisphaerae bacterium]
MTEERLHVGFIGLGIMGQPMAHNVLKAGFGLTVYNRTAGKTKPLRQAGAATVGSPAELAKASDVVVTCVSDTPDVLEVILDESRGVIAGVRADATVVDCSTVAPEVAKRCGEALAAKGAGFLDAPVSGGDVGAKAGTLSIMVGGDKAQFDRALPVLRAMGKTVTYCGGPGAGYTVKLCNQICGALHVLAASEAMALARAAGIDLRAMIQAVSSGASGSWVLKNLAPKMAAGDYKPGFFIDYQLKDLRLADEAAESLGVSLPGAALARDLFRTAAGQGHGRDGIQALYEVIRNPAPRDQ